MVYGRNNNDVILKIVYLRHTHRSGGGGGGGGVVILLAFGKFNLSWNPSNTPALRNDSVDRAGNRCGRVAAAAVPEL